MPKSERDRFVNEIGYCAEYLSEQGYFTELYELHMLANKLVRIKETVCEPEGSFYDY